VMLRTVAAWVPMAHAAFQEYRQNAVVLSATAWKSVQAMLAGQTMTLENSGLGRREWEELQAAIGRLPVV
jgi:thymidylate synthase (FAD)